MKKILFLIHDLGQGGAEKVLVNLVNNLDRSKFNISVTALFGGGINEQFLKSDIHYRCVWRKNIPANSKLMKLLTPKQLHKICVKEKYDIEISYLEGPCARIISGCDNEETKLVTWIHGAQHTMKNLAGSFRSEKEARDCYKRFHQIVCVSEIVKNDFVKILDFEKPCSVLYNTVESKVIMEKSKEFADRIIDDGKFKLIAVGTLKKIKGYERLFRIVKRLHCENISIMLYVLGNGPDEEKLKTIIKKENLEDCIIMLGYDTNPYKYVSKCDLFVCSSYSEGFSTAATEALIVGTPVCTVEVSGMKELLGSHNEYGIVVDNDEEALYQGIKDLVLNQEKLLFYRRKAYERGKKFSTEDTVNAVGKMLQFDDGEENE